MAVHKQIGDVTVALSIFFYSLCTLHTELSGVGMKKDDERRLSACSAVCSVFYHISAAAVNIKH